MKIKDLLFLARDIIYLALAGGWVLMFFLSRQAALELMPLLVVILFVNIDSRISQIVDRFKGVSNAKS
jgi:hypothetical protein